MVVPLGGVCSLWSALGAASADLLHIYEAVDIQPSPFDLARIMERSMQEDEELAHPLLNRSIESAQKKVEQQNFSIRKRLLQYDDVLNQQRTIIYSQRQKALKEDNLKEDILRIFEDLILGNCLQSPGVVLSGSGIKGAGSASVRTGDEASWPSCAKPAGSGIPPKRATATQKGKNVGRRRENQPAERNLRDQRNCKCIT